MNSTLDAILTQSELPFVLLNAKDEVIRSSPTFERLMGLSLREMKNKPVRDLIDQADRSYKASLIPLSTGGGDGAAKLLFLNESPDDLHLVAENLHMARLASLGKLLAGIIHEISNPLAVILGSAQLMSMKELPEDLAEDVGLILSESMRSSELVKKVLSFARKENDLKSRFPIQDVIEEASTLKKYSLKNNNIKIVSASAPAAKLKVSGYRAQLTQVLLNLIHNSEQAILSSEDRGIIGIQAGQHGNTVVVSVTDTGPGIPIEKRQRIFDAFYTTKGNETGTGLGLYISRNIVRKHGGDLVLLDSTAGKSEFQVKLPMYAEHGADPPDLSGEVGVL